MKSETLTRKHKRLIFYTIMVALPVLQFCIFYIYVNFNSIMLAFKKYSIVDGQVGYKVTFAGFENFKVAWNAFVNGAYMIKNSLILFVFKLLSISLALIFSFYVYKKFVFAKMFQVVLFLPQIISSVVLSVLFCYMTRDVYQEVVRIITGVKPAVTLLDNPSTRFGTVIFYCIWASFGVNVLLFTGAMSGISEDIVESAGLDGAGIVREFFSITIPMIYPTLTTFVILGIAGLFTDQMNLYTLFYDQATDIASFGYYLYLAAQRSDVITSTTYLSYPELSALGLIITVIVCTATVISRKLLEKFGPSVN